MFSGLFALFAKLFFMTGYVANTAYLKQLSAEQEKECLARLRSGDKDARETLILHNMRLVAHIAKKYPAADRDDLISIGSIGLIKGVETFSTEKGTTLATYLSRCIENEILMSLRSAKRYAGTVYLQDKTGLDSDGNEYTLMDVLAEDEENVYEGAELSILRKRLLAAVRSTLSEREQKIVFMRFGLDNTTPKTQLETAKALGISRSYVSRIETKTIKFLKEFLATESDNL